MIILSDDRYAVRDTSLDLLESHLDVCTYIDVNNIAVYYKRLGTNILIITVMLQREIALDYY